MSETTNKLSPDLRDGAVRMVDGHRADYRAQEWEAMTSIAGKIGCTARLCAAGAATRRAGERDQRRRRPMTASAYLLEREVKAHRRANEFLRRHRRILRWRSSTSGR